MTRDEYNKKVQAMQTVWPEIAVRFAQVYHPPEVLAEARFQIYLDCWRTLGVQRRPFKPDTEYEWDEDEEARVMYHLAGGVTSDRIAR
jgi:hypothetical protein